ncbi:hypothetical protein ACNHKD_04275 [Methylocystis sp. JAN1]|uniref:hypothetical protein n=1 Tax=Methylocystis sp. JAN1 TaxID=3397211 RepID=UPI003FA22208
MMPSIEECLASSLSRGEISREEHDDLVGRYREFADAERAGRTGGRSARDMLANDATERYERQRLKALLSAQKYDQIIKDAQRFMLRRADALEKRGAAAATLSNALVRADIGDAFARVFEQFGDFGAPSVRGVYSSILAEARTELADMLHAFRRSALTMRRFNRPLMSEIVDAAFGEQASPEAKAFFEAFDKLSDKLRIRFNEAGGEIKYRRNWRLPQDHNAAAIANPKAGGVEAWVRFIAPRLDWEAMKDPISGLVVAEADRSAVLREIGRKIVTGGLLDNDPGVSAHARALADLRADPRFLQFRDAQAWREYSDAYGSGSVYKAMMSHIDGMARDIALLERLGPNPSHQVERMKSVLAQEEARAKLGEPTLLEKGKLFNRAATVSRQLDGLLELARPSAVPESFIGDVGAILRNEAYGAKIGSAVLTHAFGNPVIMTMVRYLHGLPHLRTGLDLFRNIGTAREMLQAGVVGEDALHLMEQGAREEIANRKLREVSAWAPQITTHYSGLEAAVMTHKRAYAGAAMAEYANHLDKAFDALEPHLRQSLEGYGVTARDWEVMRLARLHEPATGAPFLRAREIAEAGAEKPEAVARILGVDPDEAPLAAQAVARKYLEALTMNIEAAVPSSNWRVRASVLGGRDAGMKAGTAVGEVARSAMMFKAGFLATFMLTQKDLMARELATNPNSAAAYAAASFIALTLGGMLTLQAKNLANGKDALPMDPATEQGRATWEHAMLVSGALGIYGDFIHSDRSAYGHDLLSTLAGPTVTEAEDIFHAAHAAGGALIDVATGTEREHSLDEEAEGAAIRMLRNNTPLLSTHWALRAAYNRVILDQLQYLADPKAHAKMRAMERKVRRETNQGLWWPRGEVLPERVPQLTEAAR